MKSACFALVVMTFVSSVHAHAQSVPESQLVPTNNASYHQGDLTPRRFDRFALAAQADRSGATTTLQPKGQGKALAIGAAIGGIGGFLFASGLSGGDDPKGVVVYTLFGAAFGASLGLLISSI